MRWYKGEIQTKIEDLKASKQDASPYSRKRFPQAEDYKGNRQPANTGQAFVIPYTTGDSGNIGHTTDSRNTTADNSSKILIANYVNTCGISGSRRFANGPEVQTLTSLRQEKPHRNSQDNTQIEQDAMLEKNWSENGDFLKKLGEGGVDKYAHEVFA